MYVESTVFQNSLESLIRSSVTFVQVVPYGLYIYLFIQRILTMPCSMDLHESFS